MRLAHFSSVAGAFLAVLLAPSFSYGAAQLKAGATTSAKPTAAYGTSLYAIQLSFDPDVEGGSFNVDSFRLSVQYDYTKIDVDSTNINFIAPFTETQPIITGPSLLASSSAHADFSTPGIIGNIMGDAPLAQTQPGDVFLFSIDFTLKPGVSRSDDILSFTIFAGLGDFIHGTDPSNGNTAMSTGADVIPTTIIGTYDQLAAQVPLPSVFPAGLFAFGLLALWRRRPVKCLAVC